MSAGAAGAPVCFGAVRAMLMAYVPPLVVGHDLATRFECLTPRADSSGDRLSFAQLTLDDSEVRLQLMMIARGKSPAGLISSALYAQARGPQLFAFTVPDAALFEDLARLLKECLTICRLRSLL